MPSVNLHGSKRRSPSSTIVDIYSPVPGSWKNRRSTLSRLTQSEKKKVTIWPEWNDNDINAEKWESGAQRGKEDKKGKSPVVQPAYFEDPDGRLEMPATFRVDHWKRAHEYFTEDKIPVVVDVEKMTENFDLLTNNKHLSGNELLRYFISLVTTLWDLCTEKVPSEVLHVSGSYENVTETCHNWKPWEHIYSLNKVVKNHIPLYNPYGKYIVRLYWMGVWRKIQVDDLLPFDENNQLLLPATTLQHELWPMLLAKAVLKVSSLDYSLANAGMEFGDMRILHYLTGWLPEAIPLHTPPSYTANQVLDTYYGLLRTERVPPTQTDSKRCSHLKETWELLKTLLPEWKLPEPPEIAKPEEDTSRADSVTAPRPSNPSINVGSHMNLEERAETAKDGAVTPKVQDNEKGGHKLERSKESLVDQRKGHKDKHGKEEKKDKNEKHREKDKDKKDKMIQEGSPVIPEHPEVVVFANFGLDSKPDKVSQLVRMADASERLRQNGLSHLHPHPVCITQTRSCSMEVPPPPEYVPAWKLIRPRKKREYPTDEPKAEEEPPKDIQCLELTSPFINYDVAPMHIPNSISRITSSLERGSLRKMSKSCIQELDEMFPEMEAAGLEVQQPQHHRPSSQTDVSVLMDASEQEVLSDDNQTMGGDDRLGKMVKRISMIKTKFGKKEKSLEGERGSKVLKEALKTEPRGKGRKSESRILKREDILEEKSEKKDFGKEHKVLGETAEVDSEVGASAPPPEDTATVAPLQNSRWIDFDEFCVCFRVLYIYHKPATYICNQRYSDLKNVTSTATPGPPAKADKKQAAAAPGSLILEDKSCHYLFVDSVKPVEIVVAFSVIPRWFDPASATDEKKSAKTKDTDIAPHSSFSSVQDQAFWGVSQQRDNTGYAQIPFLTPGTLVAEPFSWKSLVTGQPIMKLRTTGIKAAVVSLPPGRHVLKFTMTSPLAHHVHMVSKQPFVFGDEETIMPQLVHESCLFKDNGMQTIVALGKCAMAFNDGPKLIEARQQLEALHFPSADNKVVSRRQHYQQYTEALFGMLRRGLKEVATPDVALAWRAFTMDFLTFNVLGLPLGPRPDSSSAETPVASGKKAGQPASKKHVDKQSSEQEKPENIWMARYLEPTVFEQVAAVTIQKIWRGYWVRKVMRAATPGTPENAKAQENLAKSWQALEPNAEDHGMFLYRDLLKKAPDMMQYYPFYKDEWNRLIYTDYRGALSEQPPHTWFLIFRDIFYVREKTLAVPKMYIPLSTCLLRVIDNDTGQQLPSIFLRVAPYVYTPNRKGYTFVAEARSLTNPVISTHWRLRMIGSHSSLPAPRSSELTTNFHTRDLRECYMPNPKNIIFRYYVKMGSDQVSSVQVNTSRPDVYLRVCVMDGEEEVASATGKGHAVIPAFLFQKDRQKGDELLFAPSSPHETKGRLRESSVGSERMASSASSISTAQRTASGKAMKLKKTGSRSQPDDKSSVSRSGCSQARRDSHSLASDVVEETETHKYLIQATVLKNSWPLTEEEMAFVNKLREEERNELKRVEKERPQSSQKADKPADPKKHKAKLKGPKDKEPTARSNAFTFAPDKPYYVLRLVVDSTAAEDLSITKDTDRADEIRAMKKAWEEAEPGRAAKARQARLKFLQSRSETQQQTEQGDAGQQETVVPTSKVLPDIGQDASKAKSAGQQPIHWTSYLNYAQEKGVLVDKTFDDLEVYSKEPTLEQRQKVISQYLEQREEVENWRAQDRAMRNLAKIQQLTDAQALQAVVDKKRELVNQPREAFRQVYLEAERKRQAELAEQEEKLRAAEEAKGAKAAEKSSNKKGGPKSAAGKKKK